MNDTPASLTSAVAALGLTGGFLVARWTGRRELGGLYVAAMGGSHPLAKRIGAWPSVGVVTAVTVAATELVTRTARR